MMLLLWIAAVGQTLFVAMWATMPWWRTWIGGALMTKSASLFLVLWFWVAAFYAPDYPGQDVIRFLLIGAMTVGIWLQVFALYFEIGSRSRSRDDTVGARR